MQDTKRRILEAARRVLVRDGSNGFSCRKVAMEAEISLSNVQYHFKTRTDILRGILSGFIDEYRAYMRKAVRGGGRAALTRMLRDLLEEESRNEEIRFFRSVFAYADQDSLGGQLDEFFGEAYGLLREGLAALSGRGPDDARTHEAASVLLPLLNGYGMTSGSLALGPDKLARTLSSWAWSVLEPGDRGRPSEGD